MVPLQNGKGGLDVATLKELADRTGYSQTTISRILSGDPTYITSFNGARSLLTRLDRDELLEEIVSQYIENLE